MFKDSPEGQTHSMCNKRSKQKGELLCCCCNSHSHCEFKEIPCRCGKGGPQCMIHNPPFEWMKGTVQIPKEDECRYCKNGCLFAGSCCNCECHTPKQEAPIPYMGGNQTSAPDLTKEHKKVFISRPKTFGKPLPPKDDEYEKQKKLADDVAQALHDMHDPKEDKCEFKCPCHKGSLGTTQYGNNCGICGCSSPKDSEWEKEFDRKFIPAQSSIMATFSVLTPHHEEVKSFISSLLSKNNERLVDKVGDKWKLARFMHERYEKYAFIFGWNTQEMTKVPFEELPEENKRTMLAVADDVLSLIKSKE